MASAYNITPDKFKEKWDILLSYRKRLGKDAELFENSILSMFGYIDDDKYKVRKTVKDISCIGKTCRAVRRFTTFWLYRRMHPKDKCFL